MATVRLGQISQPALPSPSEGGLSKTAEEQLFEERGTNDDDCAHDDQRECAAEFVQERRVADKLGRQEGDEEDPNEAGRGPTNPRAEQPDRNVLAPDAVEPKLVERSVAVGMHGQDTGAEEHRPQPQ